MRVLLLCSTFPAATRPADLPSYAAIAVELVRLGHEVDVVCCADGRPRFEEPVPGLGVRRVLKGVPEGEAGSSLAVAHDCRAVRRELSRHPEAVPLVVDTGSLSPALLSAVERASPVLDLSFDSTVAALGATHPWWERCRRVSGARRAVASAAGAELTPPDFRRFGFLVWEAARWKELLVRGLPVQSAHVLVPGVDTQTFRPNGVARDRRSLMFHGSLTHGGGLGSIFLALQRLPEEFRLRILARSTEESYLAELAELGRAAGVTSRIEVVRAPGPTERAALLRSAGVFVYPPETPPTYPREALEAFATGVPVVAAAYPGHERYLRPGENALVFPAGDPRGLANAIARLDADAELCTRIVSTARRDVETRFGPTFSAEQLAAVLVP